MDEGPFLARSPPFDALDAPSMQRVVEALTPRRFAAGEVILKQEREPAEFLYIVRSGSVEVLDDNEVLDLLGEGETFGQISLASGYGPTATIRAHEDSVCLLVPGDVAREILGTVGGVAFVARTARSLLLRRSEVERSERADPQRAPAGSLIRRPPITCSPATPVGEAARLMSERGVSCLLVEHKSGLGILTDRDLRSRVVAAGRGFDVPLAEVMSSPVRTVPAEMMATEVLLLMLEGGFHHAPVTDADGSVIGVVTDTDLMGLGRRSPFALKRAVQRAPDREAVIEAGRDLPRAVCALVEARVDPVDIGRIVGVTVDALTTRLIELATHQQGPAPVPWAWLALGSLARHEQSLHTDQDHAIAFDPRPDPDRDVDPYFAAVAGFVTDGLEAAGIPRCDGDAMAANSALRRSVKGWAGAFRGWMADPGVEGSILSSIAFDHRRVAGPLEAEAALDDVVRLAPDRPEFLRHLARRALKVGPPTGFFRDLVVESRGEHAGRLDVKQRGIIIVTNLARTYAVAEGRTNKRTLERLRVAAEAGRIDQETREGLEEAFRLLWQVRLEHQAAQVEAGAAPDDFVDPRTLGPLARRGLREAFRIISRAQRDLAVDLGVMPP